MSWEHYDFLEGENPKFEANCDIYTPRPHFIFLSKVRGVCDYRDLPGEQRVDLFHAVDQLYRRCGLKRAIFCLHRGSWVSQSRRFHAHLCVDTKEYLAVYNGKNLVMPKRCVTREWKAGKSPADYGLNVEKFPFKSYYENDINDIQRYFESTLPSTTSHVLSCDGVFGDPPIALRLVFHKSLPRIGFRCPGLGEANELQARTKMAICDQIDEFAAYHGMLENNTKDSAFGCHVCLPLWGGPHLTGFPDENSLVGYIEMSALKFVQLCPKQLIGAWFKKYRESETGYCHRT